MTTTLVTGAGGFIGKNLLVALRRLPDTEVITVDRATARDAYERGLARADVVFHLAGVNRPSRDEDHEPGNAGLTRDLCTTLRRLGRKPRIVYTSSTQAAVANPYGSSKRAAEAALEAYAAETGAQVAIFRLPNVFGKWSRPHYNSVVATLCHDVGRGIPVTIRDPDASIDLVHVDDVVALLLAETTAPATRATSRPCPPATTLTVGRLLALVEEIHAVRATLVLPDLAERFSRQLYATYLAYADPSALAYAAPRITDRRGFVQELLKSRAAGQVFVSHTRPGVTRGNHAHDGKAEKFIVVAGAARIDLRHVITGERLVFEVTGDAPQVVDIPPGYVHSITNTGAGDLVTLFWASEIFDPARPDTHASDVVTAGRS